MKPGEAIERLLLEKIPITHAMGVRVVSCDETGLVLSAPLGPNRNHLGTAFGGSLNTLAVLSCYGLLWQALENPRSHIVIRSSTIAYRKPVQADFEAVCRAPGLQVMHVFREDFVRKGKARITLAATVCVDGVVAVEFEGVFVAVGAAAGTAATDVANG